MKLGDEEHQAFEKFGEKMGLDMQMHPLHLLYLNPKTANYLEAFKAGYAANRGKKCDQLQQQAEIHAQEARTQTATVHSIYQALGIQKGDWNGAVPVVELVEQLKKENANSREVMIETQRLLRNGASGTIVDTVWSDTRENTTLYEVLHQLTGEVA